VSEPVENFLKELQNSLQANSFAKLTLSNYRGPDEHLQKVTARVVETKRGRKIAFQTQHTARQTVKNVEVDEALAATADLIASGFRSAHLFTTAHDFQLTIGKKNARLIASRPTFKQLPDPSHDRQKRTLVSADAQYLKALGIATDKGEIKPQQRDKWRQINRYVEILRDMFEKSSLKDRSKLKIVDMGSGKGYLTFAAYDYFSNERGLEVDMTGVDTRADLVALCNDISVSSGFDGLRFEVGTIVDHAIDDVDILIALHACDTATDDALYKGVLAQAEIIVAAPCCHKEVRAKMTSPEFLKGVLKHAVMSERTAETVTDGLRALLLEEKGYRTKIFEFVPSEHTPKNNMIAAIRDSRRSDMSSTVKQIDDLMTSFSISDQRLHSLLKANGREQALAADGSDSEQV
jgi:hypothetical protein